jgi:hypothetical protein
MALYPNIIQLLVLFCRTVMVFHIPEMTVAFLVIPMSLQKIIFGKFQDDSEKYEEFRYNFMMYESSKILNLRPIFSYERWMRLFILGDEFWDIVDLGVVEMTWYYLSNSSLFVAVIAPIFEIRPIFQFLFCWEIEEFFADGKLMVYLLLREAEVSYVEEALILSASLDL